MALTSDIHITYRNTHNNFKMIKGGSAISIYDYKVKKRKEGELDLAELKGKVLLIVNTATGCGCNFKNQQNYQDKR